MKNLLLLFLTLFTLNVFGQDSTSTENTSDLLANKVITFIETTHDKIAASNLDISTFKLDIDWKKITKFSTIYGAVNGGNSLSDVDVYSVINGLETQTITTPYDYSVILGVRKIARMGYEPKEALKREKKIHFQMLLLLEKYLVLSIYLNYPM